MTPTLPLCKIEMLEANVDALDRGPQQYLTAQANCRVKG